MDRYEIAKIAPGVHRVRVTGDCLFYVVEGTRQAAVIDTGIPSVMMGGGDTSYDPTEVRILPHIRRITQLPLVLVVTHLHLDHMYHMEEFDAVYMSRRELTLPRDIQEQMAGGKRQDYARVLDLDWDTSIDLGGVTLEICPLPGHTPGSVMVYDTVHDLLFTGDAVGSGFGVWMHVMTATSLETYRAGLAKALEWLAHREGRMTFCGGHYGQEYDSLAQPGYNPLSIGLLADMLTLTDKLLKGELEGKPRPERPPFAGVPAEVLYAAFGRAEILYRPEGLHRDLF